MDKISGILPSSRRTEAADNSRTQPARPGAPQFGRPEGRNSIKDRVSFSSLAKVEDPNELKTYKNSKEMARSKIVDDIAFNFFKNQSTPAVTEGKSSVDEINSLELESFENIEPMMDIADYKVDNNNSY